MNENKKIEHPRVIVIILQWNNYNDSIECLNTLSKVNYPNFTVIVVDNGSINDAVTRIKTQFPHIQIIETGENLGFEGGNNIGIQYALEQGADYVLLLNNDTVVDSNFLAELVRTAESDQQIGIVAPKIYFFDAPDIIQYAGGKLSLWRGNGYSLREGEKDPGLRGTIEATFITGCAMLIRRKVIEQVGLLDENYFLVVQDVDYSYRALQAGWKLAVCLDAKIWHKVSRATGQDSPLNRYYFTRNRLYFVFRKTKGFWHKAAFALFFPTSRLVNFVLWSLTGKRHRIKPTIRGIVDFLRGRMGKSWEP